FSARMLTRSRRALGVGSFNYGGTFCIPEVWARQQGAAPAPPLRPGAGVARAGDSGGGPYRFFHRTSFTTRLAGLGAGSVTICLLVGYSPSLVCSPRLLQSH